MLTTTSEKLYEAGWQSSIQGYSSTRRGRKEKARAVIHPGFLKEKRKFDLASHARHGLRRKCHGGRLHRSAALCGNGARGRDRFHLARWDRQVFTLADEGQAVLLLVPIDANEVAKAKLAGSRQVRQWIHDMAFDRALEVPRAVALVRAFLQKEVAAGIGHAEQELTLGGFQDALLHLAQLDFEDFLKLLAPQRMKHHHFVEPVHEFGRKLAAGCFHGRTFDLFVESSGRLVLRLNESHAAFHKFGNFSPAEGRGQGNAGLGG